MKRENLISLLQQHMDVMIRLSIRRLYLFGSVARGESKEGGDFDVLGEHQADAKVGLLQFVRLRRELNQIPGY
jgi:hypothetical protein